MNQNGLRTIPTDSEPIDAIIPTYAHAIVTTGEPVAALGGPAEPSAQAEVGT